MKKQKKLLFLIFFIAIQFMNAQDIEIKGQVTDQNNTPLPGVSVLVKGTSNGILTDFDGNYHIKAKKGQVLQFSYLGLKTTEVIIKDDVTINIILKDDTESLQEVVVTALGIKRDKKALGYATQVLKSKRF